MSKGDSLRERAMSRFDVLHMIERRAKAAAPALFHLLPYVSRDRYHPTYLQNGGTLEHAQIIANHESPRTTKLYDRTREELSADETGRIRILIISLAVI